MGAISIKIPGVGEVATPVNKGDRVSDVVRRAMQQVNRDANQPWQATHNNTVLDPQSPAASVEGETIYVTSKIEFA
nr:hypothetical protein [Candidatus Sigynarchaeota archaeon]